jgi:hypothetical protein
MFAAGKQFIFDGLPMSLNAGAAVDDIGTRFNLTLGMGMFDAIGN